MFSSAIGMQVSSKPKKSGGKKIKHKGRLRLINPLVLNELTSSELTGSTFVESLQTSQSLQNKIINDSPLPKTDATRLVKKLISDYTDTQNLLKNYSDQPLDVVQSLLDIKQSTKIRETLTDLGYDSIQSNDDYILFHNNQFRVTKKLQLRDNFYKGGRVGYADGDIAQQIRDKITRDDVTYNTNKQENKDTDWYLGKNLKSAARQFRDYLTTQEEFNPNIVQEKDSIITLENLQNYRTVAAKDRLKIQNPNFQNQAKLIEDTIHYMESDQGRNKDTKQLGEYQMSRETQLDAVQSLRRFHAGDKGIKLNEEQLKYLEETPANQLSDVASRLLLQTTLNSRTVKGKMVNGQQQYLEGEGDKILKRLYEGGTKSWSDLQDAYLKLWVYETQEDYLKKVGDNIGPNLERGRKFYIKNLESTMFSD